MEDQKKTTPNSSASVEIQFDASSIDPAQWGTNKVSLRKTAAIVPVNPIVDQVKSRFVSIESSVVEIQNRINQMRDVIESQMDQVETQIAAQVQMISTVAQETKDRSSATEAEVKIQQALGIEKCIKFIHESQRQTQQSVHAIQDRISVLAFKVDQVSELSAEIQSMQVEIHKLRTDAVSAQNLQSHHSEALGMAMELIKELQTHIQDERAIMESAKASFIEAVATSKPTKRKSRRSKTKASIENAEIDSQNPVPTADIGT